MKELFNRLRHHGHQVIQELVSGRAQETVQLDFKLKENPATGDLSKNDRSVLGPALSAFANSAGGLLIWGIEAKRDADGVDAAQTCVPIANLARFNSDITRAIGELLMPRHDGIDIEAINDPGTTDAGYLAIWVDRSDRRPHRSEAAGDKRYYKRAGDSSFAMEHFDIEDAFNRSVPTQLKFVFAGLQPPTTGAVEGGRTPLHYRLAFLLSNQDRASASAPYIWIDKFVGGRAEHTSIGTRTFSHSTAGTRQVFSADGHVFVHPGMVIPAFDFVVAIVSDSYGKRTVKGLRPDAVEVRFDYGFGCQNARMITGRFEIAGINLRNLVNEEGGLPLLELSRRIRSQNKLDV